MIVDQPIETDRRVLASIRAYEDFGWHVDVLDVVNFQSSEFSIKARLFALIHLWGGLFGCLVYSFGIIDTFRRFYLEHHVQKYRLKFAWLGKRFWMEVVSCAYKGELFRNIHNNRSIHYDAVHAHDLASLSFAVRFVKSSSSIKLIYDMHELSAFRKRRLNSKLSSFLTMSYESYLLKSVSSVITVSKPYREMLKYFSSIDLKDVFVVCNSFYRPIAFTRQTKENQTGAIVYVGSLNCGRGLDKLLEFGARTKIFDIYVFCPEDTPFQREKALSIHERYQQSVKFGSYEEHFSNVLRDYKCVLGWLYLEDDCLSYRYAMPNKLFQYFQLGVPILYNSGLYYSEVVSGCGLGILADVFLDSPDEFFERFIDEFDENYVDAVINIDALDGFTYGSLIPMILGKHGSCNFSN